MRLLRRRPSVPVQNGAVATTLVQSVAGDIITVGSDAIVNAANSRLAAGGGVCGAIFAAAGHRLLEEACNQFNGCPTGFAVATPAFNLANQGTRHIIHAVGPIFSPADATRCDEQLVSAYRESLRLAEKLGARSIAIPAISTGIFGFPAERAATLVAELLITESYDLEEIVLIALEPAKAAVYASALEAAKKRP